MKNSEVILKLTTQELSKLYTLVVMAENESEQGSYMEKIALEMESILTGAVEAGKKVEVK